VYKALCTHTTPYKSTVHVCTHTTVCNPSYLLLAAQSLFFERPLPHLPPPSLEGAAASHAALWLLKQPLAHAALRNGTLKKPAWAFAVSQECWGFLSCTWASDANFSARSPPCCTQASDAAFRTRSSKIKSNARVRMQSKLSMTVKTSPMRVGLCPRLSVPLA